MKVCFVFALLLFSPFIHAKDLTRGVKLEFIDNCVSLSSENKNIIIDEYFKIDEGAWLYFTTISVKEIKENRMLAFKNAKIRNRAIGDFLKNNGLDVTNFKYKYSSFEHLWVNKPMKLIGSVKVQKGDRIPNEISESFKNINGHNFNLNSGNIIEFGAMSFEGSSSDVITVKIKEFTSKVDFVKYGVTALGDKGMLETQGMYLIEAFANGQKVALRRNVSYTLKIKEGNSNQDFYSFYGQETQNGLVWKENKAQKFYSTKSPVVEEEDVRTSFDERTGGGKFGEYYLDSEGNYQALDGVYVSSDNSGALGDYLIGKFSNLGWINCDRFYNQEEKIVMKLKVDDGICKEQFSVYIIFKDINSVLPLYRVSNGTYQTPEIPKGADVTVFAVQANGEKENRLAFSKLKRTDQKIVSIKSALVSKDDVEKYMSEVVN